MDHNVGKIMQALRDRTRIIYTSDHGAMLGSRNAVFMLVDRRHKYVHYTNEPPQEFDLETDPERSSVHVDAR